MKKITAVALMIVVLCGLMTFTACTTEIRESPDDYTIEQHVEAISKRVEERYFGADSEYTGYELYPLYNEKDELAYFLVEMEPYGILYVFINYTRMPWVSLYACEDRYIKGVWYRYRLCVDGIEPEPFENIRWGYQEKYVTFVDDVDGPIERTMPTNYRGELDDNDKLVTRTVSPYKLADALEEKMYFFDCYDGGHYVPAVKVGNAYVNLVSMETFDSIETIKNTETPCIGISILPHKPEYKL